MVKAPGYWLASCIVAVAAWYRGSQPVATKATCHGTQQSESHTVLFFLLVAHRLGQEQAGLVWLTRYLHAKNPHKLNREFVVVMEAIAVGAFPAKCKALLINTMGTWVQELAGNADLEAEQKQRWLNYFEAHTHTPLTLELPTPAECVNAW